MTLWQVRSEKEREREHTHPHGVGGNIINKDRRLKN